MKLTDNLSDAGDRNKCNSLLSKGRFLETGIKAWQPDGCMLHQYKPTEIEKCLKGREVVFIGDSIVRTLYYSTLRLVDPSVQLTGEKHSDKVITVKGIKFNFYWDPYLNGTATNELLQNAMGTPTLAVLGSGLWYLRNEVEHGQWEDSIEKIIRATMPGRQYIADQVVLLPVERVVEEQLDESRKATISLKSVDYMNERLQFLATSDASIMKSGLAIPYSFNEVVKLHEAETVDGLHYSDGISKVQSTILYNLRCNDVMPKKFPFDKTCCSQYPSPNWVQIVLLVIGFGWGPAGLYFQSRRQFYFSNQFLIASLESITDNSYLFSFDFFDCSWLFPTAEISPTSDQLLTFSRIPLCCRSNLVFTQRRKRIFTSDFRFTLRDLIIGWSINDETS